MPDRCSTHEVRFPGCYTSYTLLLNLPLMPDENQLPRTRHGGRSGAGRGASILWDQL